MVTLSQPNNAYEFMSMSDLDMNTYFTSQQQQQEKAWSERVLHDITGLLYVLSPLGKILYCSASSLQLIGYQPNELVGRSLMEFLHVDDLNLFSNNFQFSFNSMSRVKVHYRIKCKNDSYLLLETIGQPKQDVSGQSFLAISQPYISRSNGLLDSFLEMKMENEWLKKRLNDLMSLQSSNTNTVEENSPNYFSPMSHFTASPHATSPPLDFFPVQQQQQQVDPPAFYPNVQYTANEQKRRPSSGSNSTLFYFNTPLDESYNTNFANNNYFPNQYTPSVASSTDYNDVISKISSDDLFQTDNLLVTPTYLSSHNSPVTEQKDKWKRRKKNKSCEDYICTDCGTTSSPEWRKGPHGPKTLCNACGLRWAKKNKKI